jgi:hypothetical protein
MPLMDETGRTIDLSNQLGAPKGFTVTPGADDLEDKAALPSWNFQADFRRNNVLGGLAAKVDDGTAFVGNEPEPGFNPWDKIKGTADEPYFAQLAEARNQRKFDAIKRDIARENEDRKLLDSQPWYVSLITGGLSTVLDPTTFLPGGTFVKGAKGGIEISRAGARVGVAAAAGTAVQESILQQTEQTRTAGETAQAIGASLFIGGLLGGTGQAILSKAEWQRAVKTMESELENPRAPTVTEESVLEAANTNAPLRSVGAAAADAATVEQNTIAGAAAQMTAAATAKLNPILRALHSPSAAAREILLGMMENTVYLKKNLEGVASEVSAETFMKSEYNGPLALSVRATNEAYLDYVKANGGGMGDIFLPSVFGTAQKGIMNAAEFRQAVGKAMRRDDVDANPFVDKVAKEYRARVFDPLKKMAIDVGLLPKDVSTETAASYFSRLWDGRAISADEQGFKGMVSEWAEKQIPDWTQKFDKGAERRLDPIRREIDELEMGKLRRAEELKQRQGGDIETGGPGEMTEADIRQALRIVQGGAPKPKGVKTLSQFVVEAGGLVDDAGELAHRGITNKARPGMIRTERRTAGSAKGGWTLDDMARHAWENDYFPENSQRPSIDEFVEALNDDFSKTRAVLRHGDRDAYRLTELVAQLEADLARAGVDTGGKAPRFSTSDEMKGAVERVYKALDAEADRKAAILKQKLSEREADIRTERDSRFLDDPKELSKSIADEVFDTLTGRNGDDIRSGFITIKARGPLKERTFNIQDLFQASNGRAVEDYLEHDVEKVARRYTRMMGADVELMRKFGSVDMVDQIAKIREDYARLRADVTDQKHLLKLKDREEADISDLNEVRDLLRGVSNPQSPAMENYGRVVRTVNHFNYLRSMGEVALASLSETVRPAMVHGLLPYMETIGQLMTNMKGIRMSIRDAQALGQVTERILGGRMATLTEVTDPLSKRGPVEAFMESMTNLASTFNGIKLLTDMQKSISSVMTQNRILRGSELFGSVAEKEKAYLAFLGIDQSMAERIAGQFAKHGETVDKIRVANHEKWDDLVAARTYRAAVNKDVDSIITTKGVGDVPLLANTPTGRALLQFKSFALASHQRVLLRGLQEDQARFVGGLVAMATIGALATWAKAVSGNRTEKLQDATKNPGWWIGEGLDRAGVFSVPMELANMSEKASGFNPIKTPLKAFDEGAAISQKNQNRNLAGSFLGPSFGLVQDVGTVAGIPNKVIKGGEVSQADKNAGERLLPLNSYIGIRQMLRYVINPQHQQ